MLLSRLALADIFFTVYLRVVEWIDRDNNGNYAENPMKTYYVTLLMNVDQFR